jgi:prolyl-tRNA synthetase
MGGKESIEFMAASDVGEDDVAACAACGYAANIEKATSKVAMIDDGTEKDLERFPTPGVRTIADLAQFDGGAVAENQIKTLVYKIDDEPVLVLLRGDHALQDQKLLDVMQTVDARPAQPDEIKSLLGADAGSLGAVGVSDVTIIADEALRGRTSMTTGANENDVHVRNVSLERDIKVTRWVDVRTVVDGEPCPTCGEPLRVFTAIEVGHIFKLGTFYAEPLGLSVLDKDGKSVPIVMGSYGIGVERNMAASVEANHDERGIIWPIEIAPFHVVITLVRPDDEASAEVGDTLYAELRESGVEVLLDDRKERPGVKFTDAELIGVPYRVTVGPRGIESGTVEFVDRRSGETIEIAIAGVNAYLMGLIQDPRSKI